MSKNYIITFIITAFFATVNAANRPVAEEVQRMHQLNVSFYPYDVFSNVKSIDDPFKNELSKGTQAEIIPGKLRALVSSGPEAISISIPFEGTTITVDLVRSKIFTDDFTVVTGENKVYPYTPGVYYRGIIRNNPNSISAFSFFNGELYGTISDNAHGNIVIGKLKTPGNNSQYVIYSDKDILLPFPDFCNTTEKEPAALTAEKGLRTQALSTNKCARIYYEVDNRLYDDNGSDVVVTTNWITAVHNNIQTLFANDNISVAMSQVYIWTTNDPYNGANSSDQLNTFKSTRLTFNGDAAQLVAKDNNYGGLAWADALCSSFHYSYADVNFNFQTVPSYSWTIEAMTHEIGHTLGSYHTHNCGWPIGALDDCYTTEGGCPPGPTPVNGGTIMSYCHLSSTGINFNNGFGPYPRDTIIYLVDHAACLGTSCTACPVPAHDGCASPATLSVSSNCVYTPGNLCGSTETMAPFNCNGFTAANGYDVWYKFTPLQTSVNINCISGLATDAVIGIYSGTCGNLTLMDCSDATGSGGTETINATVTAGTTYFIRVYDHNSNTTGTDFAICVSQNCVGNTNNGCASATSLSIGSTCSYTNGDLCAATQSLNPSNCSGAQAQDALDLWYSITPTQNVVQITGSSGTNTDLIVGLYGGACGNLNLIRCIDTTGAGGTEQFTVTLTPGTTYYIRVYDWAGNQFGTDFRICAKYICSTPLSPTSASASVNPLCNGDSTTLHLVGTLSQFATWEWYQGACGGTHIGSGTSVNVTPSATTTYYVRAENGTCISSCKSVTVTVNTPPTAPVSAVANPDTICPGSNSSLTVTGTLSGGAGWYWYADSCAGTATGTGSTIVVNPASPTTYFVRAQNGACFSSCISTSLILSAAPSAPVSITLSNDSVCLGDSVTLNVNGTLSSGALWYWYTDSCGGTAFGQGPALDLLPTTSDTYYVRAENANCNSSCINTTVTVNPLPLSPVVIVNSDSLSVPAEAGYQWYYSSTGTLFNPFATTQQIKATLDGYYFVSITDSNGCSANSDTVYYNETGLNENLSSNKIFVFPNPANNQLNVIIHDNQNTLYTIKLYDATGKMIHFETVAAGVLKNIPLSGFAAGIYELVVYSTDRVFTRKIIKE